MRPLPLSGKQHVCLYLLGRLPPPRDLPGRLVHHLCPAAVLPRGLRQDPILTRPLPMQQDASLTGHRLLRHPPPHQGDHSPEARRLRHPALQHKPRPRTPLQVPLSLHRKLLLRQRLSHPPRLPLQPRPRRRQRALEHPNSLPNLRRKLPGTLHHPPRCATGGPRQCPTARGPGTRPGASGATGPASDSGCTGRTRSPRESTADD